MNPFVQSRRIESVLTIARQFNKLPSEILRIKDEYTAYCFDEACSNIIVHLMNDEKPRYINEKLKNVENKNFKTMSDFYSTLNL